MRLQEHDVSPDEIEATLDWQEKNALHRAAFSRVARVWHLSDEIPMPPLPLRTGRVRRKLLSAFEKVKLRPLIVAAATIMILTMGVYFEAIRIGPRSTNQVRRSTAVGENKLVSLEDGSQILMGGATDVSVEYSYEFRHVRLVNGEALFKVAKDRDRPFIVAAANGETRAIGTSFDVREAPDGVTVTVVEGIVQVEPQAGRKDRMGLPAARLGRDNQVRYSADGNMGPILHVIANDTIAWRERKLVFIDRSLSDIVTDLNRYAPHRISIDSDDVKEYRFTGVIFIDHMQDWLRALVKDIPVSLTTDGDIIRLTNAKNLRGRGSSEFVDRTVPKIPRSRVPK
jgi:transmembrane sensor